MGDYATTYQYDPLGRTGALGAGLTYALGRQRLHRDVFGPHHDGRLLHAGRRLRVRGLHGRDSRRRRAPLKASGTLTHAGYHTVAITCALAVSDRSDLLGHPQADDPGLQLAAGHRVRADRVLERCDGSGRPELRQSGRRRLDRHRPPRTGRRANVCIKAFATSAAPTRRRRRRPSSGVPAGWSKTASRRASAPTDAGGRRALHAGARRLGRLPPVLVLPGDRRRHAYGLLLARSTRPATWRATTARRSGSTAPRRSRRRPAFRRRRRPAGRSAHQRRRASSRRRTRPPGSPGSTAPSTRLTVRRRRRAPARPPSQDAGSHAVTYHATDVAGNVEADEDRLREPRPDGAERGCADLGAGRARRRRLVHERPGHAGRDGQRQRRRIRCRLEAVSRAGRRDVDDVHRTGRLPAGYDDLRVPGARRRRQRQFDRDDRRLGRHPGAHHDRARRRSDRLDQRRADHHAPRSTTMGPGRRSPSTVSRAPRAGPPTPRRSR